MDKVLNEYEINLIMTALRVYENLVEDDLEDDKRDDLSDTISSIAEKIGGRYE